MVSVLLPLALLPSPTSAAPGTSAIDPVISGNPTTAAQVDDWAVVNNLTTETSTTWSNSAGGFRMEVSPIPVNFQTDAGQWKQIDNQFVTSPGDRYALENAANDWQVRLPSDASTTAVELTNDGDAWLRFKMLGADGSPVNSGSKAVFGDVDHASSVSYELMPYGVKESINLMRPPVGDVSYTYSLDLSANLTPEIAPSGDLAVTNEEGVSQFTFPAPIMYDSAVEPVVSSAVSYALVRHSSTWQLSVRPDEAWLRHPDRVYPVVVDPTVRVTGASPDCYIIDDAPTTTHCLAGSQWLKVGVRATGGKRRSLIRFELPTLPADSIVDSAALRLWLDSTQTTNVAMADYEIRKAGKPWTEIR